MDVKQKSDFGVKHIHSILNKKMIKTYDMAHTLSIGLRFNKNLMWVGPGGHGKSDAIRLAFEGLGLSDKLLIVQCHRDMLVEDLWGGIDMQYAKETGIQRYNLEHGIAGYEYVLLEEGGEMNMGTALSMKDPLQSGYFWNAGQKCKIKTKCVIMTSNIPRDELAVNDSIQALTERFPVELEVKWDSYTPIDYMELFDKVFKQRIGELAAFISEVVDKGDIISPRTAVHMAELYLDDIDNTRYVAGIAKEHMIDFKKKIKEAKRKWEVMEQIHAKVAQLELGMAETQEMIGDASTWKDVKDLRKNTTKGAQYLREIEKAGIPLDDKIAGMIGRFKRIVTQASEKAESLSQELFAKGIPNPYDDEK